MRVTYSESFPTQCPDAGESLRAIHRIVEERLAEEIAKKLAKQNPNNIA